MTAQEIHDLATAYIAHFSNPIEWDAEHVATHRDNSDTRWASAKVVDITYENPELLWDFILEVLRRDPPDSVIEILAAGALEDYLTKCGESVIARVESRAATDSKFRDLLGGVWQNSMTEEVWARVKACRGIPW